jgi:uncharacterized protein
LTPGTDVREFLENWIREEKIEAGVILTMVGSLQAASIRMAGRPEASVLKGPFEIVSCEGTLSPDGIHVHVAIADSEGKMLGGHLSRGSKVNTTIELVILNLSDNWLFERIPDSVTKDPELKCTPKFLPADSSNGHTLEGR